MKAMKSGFFGCLGVLIAIIFIIGGILVLIGYFATK